MGRTTYRLKADEPPPSTSTDDYNDLPDYAVHGRADPDKELHDLIERGPDWNTIEDIVIRLNRFAEIVGKGLGWILVVVCASWLLAAPHSGPFTAPIASTDPLRIFTRGG
jgi:hypothetical protein